MKETGVKIALAGFLTAVTGFLGGWDESLKALVIFIVIDYISGVARAIFEQRLSSDIGLKGIIRKLFLLVMVGVGTILDNVIGQEPYIRTVIIYFLLANEGISIIENVAEMGVPIPDLVKNILLNMKEGKSAK